MEQILVRTVLQIVPLVMTGQVFVVNAVLLILSIQVVILARVYPLNI